MGAIQDYVAVAANYERLADEAPHPDLASAYLAVAREYRAVAAVRRRLMDEGVDLHSPVHRLGLASNEPSKK